MRIIILMTLLAFLASCGGTKKLARENNGNATSSKKYDESFDPSTLNDDDIIIARAPRARETEEGESVKKKESAPSGETRYREVNGFQVQIFVTKDLERATLVR
ncbi:MAG TPA: hypothetical protein ENJ15_00785, partial [Caldithrix abyssi]|nr:hypothetical protein [Caldithrix abyssi]